MSAGARRAKRKLGNLRRRHEAASAICGLFHAWREQALRRALTLGDIGDDDYDPMCPACVTPWSCNGCDPHGLHWCRHCLQADLAAEQAERDAENRVVITNEDLWPETMMPMGKTVGKNEDGPEVAAPEPSHAGPGKEQ